YYQSACDIIGLHPAGKPLTHTLKSYFSARKKIGSRDRRFISGLVYAHYRCVDLLQDYHGTKEVKLAIAFFICHQRHDSLVAVYQPDLAGAMTHTISEKLQQLSLDSSAIFRNREWLSAAIDTNALAFSLLTQPDLFIRIRPQKKSTVYDQLTASGLTWKQITETCLQLPAGTSLDQVVTLNRDVVVQDRNSQRVLDILDTHRPDWLTASKPIRVWDACAASGGKSILVFDHFNGNIQLTASDKRENILANYRKRLHQANIRPLVVFQQDLQQRSGLPSSALFDLIICDVPCSGSGTWSRTPEQMGAFTLTSLQQMQSAQQAIVSNAVSHLDENGLLLYITCSVFSAENEEQVANLEQTQQLQCLEQVYWNGYDQQADTLFVALFEKRG
ncbi:MAG: Fmu (Sun) domain protein, partial [Ferruginibacter sp.]